MKRNKALKDYRILLEKEIERAKFKRFFFKYLYIYSIYIVYIYYKYILYTLQLSYYKVFIIKALTISEIKSIADSIVISDLKSVS